MNSMKFFFLSAFVALLSSVGLALQQKPAIVLVHGAFEDAQIWNSVKINLEGQGFIVAAVNLPGRDQDTTPIDQITLDFYRSKILDVVDAQTGPVVLVGHSFGGINISNAAEAEPLKIKTLIYLSALLPMNGQSLESLIQEDTASVLSRPGNLVLSDDGKYISVANDAVKEQAFANDANDQLKKIISAGLVREPIAPLMTPVTLTAERFGKVRKAYIMTTEDQCLDLALQVQMLKETPVSKVIKLNAGHSAFITQPVNVANAIIDVMD